MQDQSQGVVLCFLATGSQERILLSNVLSKKLNPQTQPNANPFALLGGERLVNL